MESNKKVINIKIDDIIPNRFQPRLVFDQKTLDELVSSIKIHGIIQPLILRQVGQKYEIIAGERRYKAATIAGLTEIPAIVEVLDDKTSAELALIENIQRENLTPIEEAKSYKQILDLNNSTQEELAERLGKNQSTISNKLRLLNLSPKVQEALLKNSISERHARALLQLKDFNNQEKLLNEIINKKINVKDTNDLIYKQLNNDSYTEKNHSEVNSNDIININNLNNIQKEERIENMNDNGFNQMNNNEQNQQQSKFPSGKFFPSLEDETVNMEISEQNNLKMMPQLEPTPIDFNGVSIPTNPVVPPIENQPVIEPQSTPIDFNGVSIPTNPVVPPIESQPVIEPQSTPIDFNGVSMPTNPVVPPIENQPVIEPTLLTANQNFTTVKPNISDACLSINNNINELNNKGFNITKEYLDLPGIYQITIKIEK